MLLSGLLLGCFTGLIWDLAIGPAVGSTFEAPHGWAAFSLAPFRSIWRQPRAAFVGLLLGCFRHAFRVDMWACTAFLVFSACCGDSKFRCQLDTTLNIGLTSSNPLLLSQVLAIFVGVGSAGKSVLLALLRRLLGSSYKDVRKEILVNAKGQRVADKGAASPLEAGEKVTFLLGWQRVDAVIILIRTRLDMGFPCPCCLCCQVVLWSVTF